MYVEAFAGGGGSAGVTEFEFFVNDLAGGAIFTKTTTKKAKGIYLDYIVSGARHHYYVSVDAPNNVYYGSGSADAIDSNYSATFTDSAITFNRAFSSSSRSIAGVVVY